MFTYLFFLSSGLFLGWSLGANDASNIFGTAVGTKMLRFSFAAAIAGIFIILGSVLSGQNTADTLNTLGSINTLPAAFSVSLSSALAVFLMLKSGISVSISQAIVGGIVGWNLYTGSQTNIETLARICSSWIICPIIAGCIAVILYWIIKGILGRCKIHLLWQDWVVRVGMILTTALGGYALGANNMANVVGVFIDSCKFSSFKIGNFYTLSGIQVLFLLGGIAACTGVFTYSQKTIKNVGRNLLSLSPMVAWIVILSQSLVLIMFSSNKIEQILLSLNLPTLPAVPVSSTQAVIGAIIGIGIAKGGKGIKWGLVLKLMSGWVASPVIALVLSYISLSFMENVFRQPVILP
ncbi:MAG: anion permease [Alphaproteobacteria bacterium]|nr:anion permease [Alphaproteobacteria bacterium]